MGRPSKYSEKVSDGICYLIALGYSLAEICKLDEMPGYRTIMTWLSDEKKGDFRHKYARAREDQADYLADEIIDIADEPVTCNEDVARNRLRVDARKWVASKLKPKKYGDKIEHEVGGPGGASIPIHVHFREPKPKAE